MRRHGLDDDDGSDVSRTFVYNTLCDGDSSRASFHFHVLVQTESASSRPETPTLHASQADAVIIAELKERNKDLEKVRHFISFAI